ncbi:MAG: toll/interleukin-1 receptor domain-containing protein, partial [Oscillibacter sp.]|nr:toll/interleukin-1 receptor domain-containing protein [Oscillibacter sp.]
MAEVFISYHEASAGLLAEEIAGRLDKAGITSWCARRDMPPGADFARAIPAQINACKVFLLLLNENVYKSKHIESELGMAFSRWNHEEDIRILPVEIGNFTRRDWIWYYLIHTQSVKFP